MEATRKLVEQSQGKSVRLKDVAERAGVSRQAIYLHFGSRVGLMVATVQYVDEVEGFFERTRHVRASENGLVALDRFILFWVEYMPSISGLAKVLLATREADPAAAAAWTDRMDGLWNICHTLTRWIERDGQLAPVWTAESAADIVWTIVSVQAVDGLMTERGWSKSECIERLQQTLRRALTLSE